MGVFIIGIVTAFNILIIFKKITMKRYQDATFDAAFLVLLTLVFGGTYAGMTVAAVSSAIVSIYFLFNEPNFLVIKEEEEETHKDEQYVDDPLAKYNIKKVKFK